MIGKRLAGVLRRQWFSLTCLLLIAVILGGVGIRVENRPDGLSTGAATLGIGEKVITIGSSVDAAGTVDYTYGAANANVQFQAALNALPATGGRLVVVSAGTISFAAGVTRAIDNVTIDCTGAGSYFTRDAVNPIFTAGGNNWVFTNLRTDAGGLNMGATTGWVWNNVTINATKYALRTPATIRSDAATGTSPFTVASTTKVTNLNADTLDGYTSADFTMFNGAPTLTVLGSVVDTTNLDGPQGLLLNGRLAYTHSWSAVDPADHNKAGVVAVWDISQSTPVLMGSVSSMYLRASPHDMGFYAGRYLITDASTDAQPGWNDSGMAIIDVSNPSLPVITSVLFDAVNLSDAHGFTVDSRGIAWAMDSDGSGITSIDIRDPENPFVIKFFTDALLLSIIGMNIQGNLMYASCDGGGSDRLTIVDISNPALPVILGSVQDHTLLADAHDPRVRGQYVYVASRVGNALVVIDAGDTANPVIVGSVVDNTQLAGAHSFVLLDKYALVACIYDYLTLVDISNPALPVVVSSLTGVFDFPDHLEVTGNTVALVSSLSDSLHLISLNGPRITSARIGSLEVDNLMVNNDSVFAETIRMMTGGVEGKSRLVMKRVPDLVVNLAASSSVGPSDLDLTNYVSENAYAVILRISFKDTASSAADIAFVIKYSDTYDLANLGNDGHRINSAWHNTDGTMMLPGTKILRYQLWASGAGTASVKVYVMGYFE